MAFAPVPELQSRTEQRKRYAIPVRIELAEGDLDTHDRRFADLMGKLDKLNARATSLLIAMVTTTIMLAGNLVWVHH